MFALHNVVEWKYKVAENGNAEVQYKYLEMLLKYSSRVTVLSYSL